MGVEKDKPTPKFKSAVFFLLRLITGCTAGYVMGSFISGFFRLQQSHELVMWSAVLAGMVLASLGNVRIPLFWFWFSLVFGLICMIPLCSFDTDAMLSNSRYDFPLVIVYFGGQPLIWKVFFLFLHTTIALTVAGILNTAWPFWKRQIFSR
ncbi:hypothetical protein [Gimesia fumaroli]|jgi:hypothetical protein|uniref:Uncharacterized protein n=1 Tax=Gimesia fumaroli TaxID=2527976 RepID=A0A518ICY9_9PLAN|nr:hypothetical protein [Gimesia fumaroli]QDV50971.1 hypothetical protein Enr17x_30160 [Gimesia fumaroli]